MSESDLQNRISELEAHNFELLTENKKLRKMLGLQEEKTPTVKDPVLALDISGQNSIENISTSSVNKYSSPDEKIELFLSLFQGRTDVFAKRCYSKKYGSSYYIPACKNE